MKQKPIMKYKRALTSLILSLTSILSIQVNAAEPGVTPGEFSVDASGAANYTVPIAVPPGTAGMQPSLTLSYNSRSGNGILGVGWSIGGLSVITRCPTTRVQDGYIDGIDYDSNDRYCIDGQRLIQVTGNVGDYGKDNIEYRTEVEGYTQVISYDTDSTNNGPEYFIAKTKSGQILEYGKTTDSRIEAEGKSDARLWAVNKIEDTTGNYLTVTYNEDTTNGSYTPTQIDYTGNNSASPVITPNTQVVFEYETRSDTPTLYQAGSKIQNTQRLTNIKTYTDTTNTPILIRDYQLTYDNNGAANRSRLTQLQECDGQATQECFKPIVLTWKDETNGSFQSQVSTAHSGATYQPPQLADINGDGITDWIYTGTTLIYAMLGNADGTFNSQITTSHSGIRAGYVNLGDFNGDGLADWIYTGTTLNYVKLSNGDGTFGAQIISSHPGANSFKLAIIDVNGDGLSDWVYTGTTLIYVKLAQGDGTFGTQYTTSHGGVSSGPINFADFNGDGLTDWVYTGTTLNYIKLSNGDGTFGAQITSSHSGTSYQPPQFTDINGDGLPDWVYTGTTLIYTMLGQGDGTFGTQYTTSHSGVRVGYINLGDFNGDGLTDWIYTGTTLNYVKLSNGDGTFGAQITSSHSGANSSGIAIVDVNGDGLSDWLYTGTTYIYNYLMSGSQSDIVSNIKSSLNTETTITYTPITDTTVYSKGSSATYPEVDIQGPVYVVSKVTVDDGIGGTRDTDYSYSEAKSSLDGRGFLGFKTMTAVDSSTGINTTTTYSQTYPYIGLVERTEQRQSNNDLLGEVASTFANKQTHTGIETDVSHPGVLFPYAANVNKKDYELGGTP